MSQKYIDYVVDCVVNETELVWEDNKVSYINLPYKRSSVEISRVRAAFGDGGYIGDFVIYSFYQYIISHYAVPEEMCIGIWELYWEKMSGYLSYIVKN